MLMSIIPLVYQYQLLKTKKKEVYCRILVGDTLNQIKKRFILECLFLEIIPFLGSISTSVVFKQDESVSLILFFVLGVYTSLIVLMGKNI